MGRARTLRIWAHLLLAVAVLAGVSQHAIAALFCATDDCPKMAMKAKVPDPRPCCPESQSKDADHQKEKGGTCCCKIESVPDALPGTDKVALSAPILVFLDLPVTPKVAVDVVAPTTDIILFEADSSPPDRPDLPDRGRAPPVLPA